MVIIEGEPSDKEYAIEALKELSFWLESEKLGVEQDLEDLTHAFYED